ncbi:MAG TPA: hypothetical protein VMV69_23480 [Pirellulales bacterium]|nr:hypothetical protein [Pirellulales bacterium]
MKSFEPLSAASREQRVAELRQQLRQFEQDRRPVGETSLSTGCGPLDRLLPGGGLSRGGLVEWLAAGAGSGAASLALVAARGACREHGSLVVIDGRGTFYPPAAALAGIELEGVLVVRAEQAGDEAWALDQALRSMGVGAVFCQSDRLHPRAVRRLQLAAESSGGLGLLVRPETARQEPCWAEARLLVRPLPTVKSPMGSKGARRLRVELLRARGGAGGRSVDLEIDDEKGVVCLAAELAAAAAERRSGA